MSTTSNNASRRHWAIVPAAGNGMRFGALYPKQYERVNGRTLIEHSVSPLLDSTSIEKVIIAISPDDEEAQQLPLLKDPRVEFTIGGNTRAASVLNALLYLEPQCSENDWVIVHDAVRPCLTRIDLNQFIHTLEKTCDGLVFAIPSIDTLKQVDQNCITSTIDRSAIWQALTPQAFPFWILLRALQHNNEKCLITDESSAVEKLGYKPTVIQGSRCNIKVTYPEDLQLVALYLSQAINQPGRLASEGD